MRPEHLRVGASDGGDLEFDVPVPVAEVDRPGGLGSVDFTGSTFNDIVIPVAPNAPGPGRGEVLLERLYDHLAKDADVSGSVRVLKSSVSVPPEPADWARLTSEASVAITGFGG